MNFGFIIPVYRHGSTLESVVKNLVPFNYPIIVVDDGNDEENRRYIEAVEKNYSLVTVITHKKNKGKGKAIFSAVREANRLGLTHVLQIDSDGQHDAGRVEFFIKKSQENPDAIICAYPEYDKDAPQERVNGRRFANNWVHKVTFSKEIIDGMIGFRVYPVAPFVKMLKHTLYVDSRMGCDIEILVRLYWKGIKVVSEPVKIFYPKDGISNYNYFTDTVRLSWMYTRLCAELIFRFPFVLINNHKRKKNG